MESKPIWLKHANMHCVQQWNWHVSLCFWFWSLHFSANVVSIVWEWKWLNARIHWKFCDCYYCYSHVVIENRVQSGHKLANAHSAHSFPTAPTPFGKITRFAIHATTSTSMALRHHFNGKFDLIRNYAMCLKLINDTVFFGWMPMLLMMIIDELILKFSVLCKTHYYTHMTELVCKIGRERAHWWWGSDICWFVLITFNLYRINLLIRHHFIMCHINSTGFTRFKDVCLCVWRFFLSLFRYFQNVQLIFARENQLEMHTTWNAINKLINFDSERIKYAIHASICICVRMAGKFIDKWW